MSTITSYKRLTYYCMTDRRLTDTPKNGQLLDAYFLGINLLLTGQRVIYWVLIVSITHRGIWVSDLAF